LLHQKTAFCYSVDYQGVAKTGKMGKTCNCILKWVKKCQKEGKKWAKNEKSGEKVAKSERKTPKKSHGSENYSDLDEIW
jgi:hypothetical protein